MKRIYKNTYGDGTVEYVEYEIEEAIEEEAQHGYTAEQLEAMSSAELREICSELGISGTMTKANMITLIMDKQSNSL